MRILIIAVLLALCAVGCDCGRVIMGSTECDAYIACFEKTGGTKGSLDATYGASGSCWMGSGAQADSCSAACKNALAMLKGANPDAGCLDR